MPSSEDWLTQCLGRIISHEVHIPPYLQEVLLSHSSLREIPILGKMLTKLLIPSNYNEQIMILLADIQQRYQTNQHLTSCHRHSLFSLLYEFESTNY